MSYHKITVVGNAGSEATVRVTQSEKEVANFRLAVNERVGDKEHTTWYKITAWNKLSQMLGEHLRKGQLLLIEGTPSVEVWTDKDDETRAQIVITAQTVRFLGGKPVEDEDDEDEDIPA